MRPPPFEYLEPTTVAEACAELERHRERCAVLAGGQSLVAQLNARLRRPEFVLSIARIPELATVTMTPGSGSSGRALGGSVGGALGGSASGSAGGELGGSAGGELRIGAAVTQRDVQRGPAGEAVPVLREALDCVGHVPTRNRGTVGGSIAFADPTAELPAVLLALGGTVVLRSAGGERTVPAAEFFVGPFRTAMWPDELLTAVCIPLPAGAWAFEQRHFRRHAKVSVVAGYGDAGLTVAVAGVTDTPVLLADTGAAAARLRSAAPVGGAAPVGALGGGAASVGDVASVGRAAAEDGIASVAAAVADLVTPNADHYGSPAYRRRLAVAATEAVLRRVLVPGAEAA